MHCNMFAAGVALVIAGGEISHSWAGERPCVNGEQLIAEIMTNYFISKGVFASLCDELVEGVDTPKVNRFLSSHQKVLAAHDKLLTDCTEPLNGVIVKYGVTPDRYFASQIAQAMAFIKTSGDVTNEKCRQFYIDLNEREKSWNLTIGPVIVEYLAWKDEYLCNRAQ